ncbi:MAG: hypothetical protein CSA72_09605 [Rhodobacterales bacterium]|nr:MAG: hypothetical protein CSA72_09605 [Rhodobacterales bacterium]
MKAIKLFAILGLVAGCAGSGTYGVENPNAGRNAAVTGVAVGTTALLIYGLVGVAVFTEAINSIND